MNGSGCKNCPARPCETMNYRGSTCSAQRARLGLGDPMTNADRIRAMSDEELARWMIRYQRQVVKETLRTLGTEEHVKVFEEALGENPDCTDVVRWLKEPVKDK